MNNVINIFVGLSFLIMLFCMFSCNKDDISGCMEEGACNFIPAANLPKECDWESCFKCTGEEQNHHVVVTVFLYENCPISQDMCGPLRDAYNYFCDTLNQPILFRAFFPNTMSTQLSLEEFSIEYNIPFSLCLDYDHINNKNGEWTTHYNPIVTPEVFIESPAGTLVYRGMIDNSYLALGQWSPATEYYLFDVLANSISGDQLTYYETDATDSGCLINY